MHESDPTPDESKSASKSFRWSFSFGSKPEELQKAIEEARAAGLEPVIHEHVWNWKLPVESSETSSYTHLAHADPLRTIKRVMAWVPIIVWFSAVGGGILLGYNDPTLGPIWGGIFGLVLGSFAASMLRPHKSWF